MTADSDPAPPPDDLRSFDALEAIIRRLHGPDGCPWDREQTHESLRPHLIEEAYELLEAIDSGKADAIAEELGDVLLQVLMHAAVAERLGEFELGDVISRIAAKLVARHPARLRRCHGGDGGGRTRELGGAEAEGTSRPSSP